MTSADDGSSETQRRPMFGSAITGYGPCSPTGDIQADGGSVCACQVEVTTYVFWIGFPHDEIRYTTC